MHSAGLELTKLTYTRLEDNLIRHRGDRYIITQELLDGDAEKYAPGIGSILSWWSDVIRFSPKSTLIGQLALAG